MKNLPPALCGSAASSKTPSGSTRASTATTSTRRSNAPAGGFMAIASGRGSSWAPQPLLSWPSWRS